MGKVPAEERERYIEHVRWIAVLAVGAIAFSVQLVIAKGPPAHSLWLTLSLVALVFALVGLFFFVGRMLGSTDVTTGTQTLYMGSMALFVLAMVSFCICSYFWVFSPSSQNEECGFTVTSKGESSARVKLEVSMAAPGDEIHRSVCGRIMAKWLSEADSNSERAQVQNGLPLYTSVRIAVLHFAEGSDVLDATARQVLDDALPVIKQSELGLLRVIGGTDTIGSDSANYALGERRAQMVAEQLRMHMENDSRIETNSFGERRLEIKTADAIEEAANRTVVIELVHRRGGPVR
jgi:outer membrane protein OmpA-like peptidoglycan-associated protein